MTESPEERKPTSASLGSGASWSKRLRRLDTPFKFVGKLAAYGMVASIFGTLIGSYFQYNSWREEKQLTQYKEDYSNAISAVSETLRVLAPPASLQRQLFRLSRVPLFGQNADDPEFKRLVSKTYSEYLAARAVLSRDIGYLSQRLEILLDWPAGVPPVDNYSRTIALSDYMLATGGFDCRNDFPNVHAADKLVEVHFKGTTVDWRRSRDHLATMLHCLEFIHGRLEVVLRWASTGTLSPPDQETLKGDIPLTLQAQSVEWRLEMFTAFAMLRLDQLRNRNRTRGFECHLTDIFSHCRG